jgi:hypothetical protein
MDGVSWAELGELTGLLVIAAVAAVVVLVCLTLLGVISSPGRHQKRGDDGKN